MDGGPDHQLAYFVGRAAVLPVLISAAERSGGREVVDVAGVSGIGKTMLLGRVRQVLEGSPGVCIAWADLAQFNPRPPGGSASTREDNFDRYRHLLRVLAGQLPEGDFGDFGDLVLSGPERIAVEGVDVTGAAITLWPGARIEAERVGQTDVSITLPATAYIDQARTQLTAAFVARACSVAQTQRVVLLLDDVDRVLDEPLAAWVFGELVAGLTNAAVIVARAESRKRLPGGAGPGPLLLENLGRDDVTAYLRKRLPALGDAAVLAEAIMEFSGGHPQAVALAVDLYEQSGGPATAEVAGLFDDLPRDRRGQLSELVDRIVDELDDADVRAALEVAWVVRTFDALMLRALLGPDLPGREDGGDDRRFERMIEAVSEYSFARRVPYDQWPTPAWEFHEFIRRERALRLETADPERHELLHSRAATECERRLRASELERGDETAYARALRHDSTVWRALEREWYYHLAHLRDRRRAGTALADRFLVSFYWYGWYQPSYLCDRLLDDWSHRARSPEDRDWLDLVRTFRAGYPTVWDRREADWDAVREALLGLLDLAGADGPLSACSREQRHLRMFADMFLAQSYLRTEPESAEGEAHYAEARAIVRDFPADAWLVPWIEVRLGQAMLARDDLEQASAKAEEALTSSAEQGDLEARARAFVLRADAGWGCVTLDASMTDYVCAVCCAFLFLGLPGEPDAYTRAFYDEIRQHVVERVDGLWTGGSPADARAACGVLIEVFAEVRAALQLPPVPADVAEYLVASRRDEVADGLLPPVPTEAALAQRISLRRANRLMKEMLAQTGRGPGGSGAPRA